MGAQTDDQVTVALAKDQNLEPGPIDCAAAAAKAAESKQQQQEAPEQAKVGAKAEQLDFSFVTNVSLLLLHLLRAKLLPKVMIRRIRRASKD